MGEAYKPNSEPYTEEEIGGILAALKVNPTFDRDNGGSVSTSEIFELLGLMRRERGPESVQSYTDYWDKHHNGRIYLELLADGLRVAHKNADLIGLLIARADMNKDGYISEDEFADMLKLMEHYDSRLTGLNSSFEEFTREADTDGDGKVSLEECNVWIQHKLNPKPTNN